MSTGTMGERRARISARTLRTDRWWIAPLVTFAGLSAWVAYATVRVWSAGSLAGIEIADDGIGGADDSLGTGLRGLADRVEALDGRLRVVSPPGGGTVVTAELPCGS